MSRYDNLPDLIQKHTKIQLCYKTRAGFLAFLSKIKKRPIGVRPFFGFHPSIYALTPFKALARRDFWREAAFLWISPLFAALSIFLEAVTKAA